MRKATLIILLLFISLTGIHVDGKSYYNSVRNNFGGLFPHPGMNMAGRYKAIDGDRLVEENAATATAITLDTMTIYSTAYRYQLRIANLNNKQGKTRTVKDPATGTANKITAPEWGLVFDRDEHGNYSAVVLSCNNSTPFNDIADQRTMLVSVVKQENGNRHLLAQTSLTKGISLEDDLNTLCVDVDERGVIVSMGKDQLTQVLETGMKRGAGPVRVGYLTGPGSRISLERAVLTIDNERQTAAVSTMWTRESLDEYFSQSTDPVEGYWKYLDRDMQDEWLRLGGRYTIALTRNGSGYDMVYIDGGQVKKSLWKTGMMKGRLTKTQFTGNYDATWIDATMEAIDNDSFATIENGIILTVHFPVFNSQVRFAKVLNLDD